MKFADLTEKEMAQLRAEGKCFNCKETGHLSRNCPRKNNMAGKGNNKPPGLPSYSMEMTILDEDLDDGDTLDTMPVGAIDFGEPKNQEFIESAESW